MIGSPSAVIARTPAYGAASEPGPVRQVPSWHDRVG